MKLHFVNKCKGRVQLVKKNFTNKMTAWNCIMSDMSVEFHELSIDNLKDKHALTAG